MALAGLWHPVEQPSVTEWCWSCPGHRGHDAVMRTIRRDLARYEGILGEAPVRPPEHCSDLKMRTHAIQVP